ncbi:hypothetical protein [Sinimarinibacterium thermocellulolyticum]|uniref:Uncharacterized protein n=1 Tax=Sinimarinibacterium thermocellulolyticum TaxID=3170016 RepID=A0ABV2A8X5_9GAMM
MTSIRRFSAALCAAAVLLQTSTPSAWAQETITPALGVHWSWGDKRPVALRLGAGLHLTDVRDGVHGTLGAPAGAGFHTAYVPLWSLPVTSAADIDGAVEAGGVLTADQKSRGSGAAVGAVLVLGGLAAIVLIAKNRFESQSSGSSRGDG